MNITKYISLLCILWYCSTTQAQSIRINEVVSSNINYLDEDRESPDWIELYNAGTEDVSLEGYFISDKSSNPTKWKFPNIEIKSDEYLVVWASQKDRDFTINWKGLVTQGDEFKYLVPQQAVDPNWTNLDFDDSSWANGNSGFGYDDGDDTTIIPQGSISVYLRRKFTIQEVDDATAILLDMDYDDGYVAYINGVEIARANINGNPPNFDDTTITDHEALIYEGGVPERVFLNNLSEYLQEGENVLCIQGHNISNTSSDFTLIPFLSIGFPESNPSGFTPADILNLSDSFLHTNFKISASGETVSLYNSDTMLLSSIEVPALSADISYGINQQTFDTVFFEIPTPGSINSTQGFIGQSDALIQFSHEGGQTDPIELSMTVIGNKTIRYTLDASIPNIGSPVYTDPININETTIVRARIFEDQYIPSRTQTKSYLVNINHNLPIISLVTDPDNFFNEQTGIYVLGPEDYDLNQPFFGANFWEEWERPINFSFYDDENNGNLSIDGGVKIFGGWSRANPQKSLSIFARKQYGSEEMDYPIFQNLPYQTFQALVLRNSGNDWLNSNIRDGVLTGLMEGSGIEIQAYRPAATYLNGEYWGTYNVREKINEHFIASKFDIDPDSIKVLELEGLDEEYQAFFDFVLDNSLIVQSNYDYVDTQMDLDNFIMYNVAQIFINNTDWPGNNIKFWKSPDTKWRWIIFDTDFGFGIWNPNDYNNNTLDFALESNGNFWPNPPWSTLLFRRLMANDSFEIKFVNRFADELNTRFLPLNVRAHIDSIASITNSDMQQHFNRWGGFIGNYSGAVSNMRTYANLRPLQVKEHILSTLNLPDFHRLTAEIDDPIRGFIELNSLTLNDEQWEGDYFEDIPIDLAAIPKAGFQFSHWSGDIDAIGIDPNEATIKINMPSALTLKANFTEIISNTELLQVVESFDLYPNPSSSNLNIRLYDEKAQVLSISIFDQNTKLIQNLWSGKSNRGETNLSFQLAHLPKGVYLIQLKNAASLSVTKEWFKIE